MQFAKKNLLTLLSGYYFIDLHFFIATIQIGVIVQVCYGSVASVINFIHLVPSALS